MSLRIVSSLALAAAMAVSPAAFAQTMMGGSTVSADDLPFVQQRCDELAREQSSVAGGSTLQENTVSGNNGSGGQDNAGGGGGSGSGAGSGSGPDAGTSGGGGETKDSDDANEINQSLSSIDLNTVTIEQCRTAGLVTP